VPLAPEWLNDTSCNEGAALCHGAICLLLFRSGERGSNGSARRRDCIGESVMSNLLQRGETLIHEFLQSVPLQKDRVKHLGERQLLSLHDCCSQFYPGEDQPRERILDVLKDLSEALENPSRLVAPNGDIYEWNPRKPNAPAVLIYRP